VSIHIDGIIVFESCEIVSSTLPLNSRGKSKLYEVEDLLSLPSFLLLNTHMLIKRSSAV
jgi:hypothetical protein